jgi:hypothetical protein
MIVILIRNYLPFGFKNRENKASCRYTSKQQKAPRGRGDLGWIQSAEASAIKYWQPHCANAKVVDELNASSEYTSNSPLLKGLLAMYDH